MAHLFLHAIIHSLEDVLKSAPILLVVYAVLYWLEHKMRAAPTLLEKAQKVGPIIGAAAGSVPQCGFSAAASALFVEGFLHPATLVAVFLATSDEAVPLLLSGGMTKETVLLLIVKFIIAVAGGYLLQWTVFRKKKHSTTPVNIDISHHHGDCCGASVVSAIVWRTVHTCLFLLQWTVFRKKKHSTTPVNIDISHHHGDCCGASVVSAIVWRTVHTCLFLLGIMVVINLAVEIVGEDTIASLLLSGSLLQPVLCAVIGLIPSCAISVLLSELYMSGAIGFGGLIAGLSMLLSGSLLQPVLCAVIGLIPSCAISVLLSELYMSGAIGFGGLIAGLSTGAGFGYMILLRERSSRRRAIPVIAATWVLAAMGGILCQMIWN